MLTAGVPRPPRWAFWSSRQGGGGVMLLPEGVTLEGGSSRAAASLRAG